MLLNKLMFIKLKLFTCTLLTPHEQSYQWIYRLVSCQAAGQKSKYLPSTGLQMWSMVCMHCMICNDPYSQPFYHAQYQNVSQRQRQRHSHKHNSSDGTKSWQYITMMTLQGRKKLTTVKYEITGTLMNTVKLNTWERGQTMWSASTASLSQHRSNRHNEFFVTCCMLANGVFAELKCSWHNATSSFITEHAQPCFHLWTCALMVTFMVLMTVHAQCTVKYNPQT